MSKASGSDETPTLADREGARNLAQSEFAPPERIGRFLVLEELGRGGMGVVFAAYDPDLDRKVAVKVLGRVGSGRSEDVARLRLQREAQAMAKLSHPNVATVYDVGIHDGRVFLAIELVSGRDLRAWVEARGPELGWRGIVAVFCGAGRGLAAAHSVGIVHRDFKPANVLVDEHDRARVLDFGLASLDATDVDAVPRPVEPRLRVNAELTDAGVVMGTPAYMAPEQFRGDAVDARSDQYAFCVALYECLAGRRPFEGDSFAALRKAVLAGRAPPTKLPAPSFVVRAILRGLATEPADRWPDMDALLVALARDPSRRRRRRAGLVVGALAVGATGWGVHQEMQRRAQAIIDADPCTQGPTRLATAWNESTRAEVVAAFRSAGLDYGEDTLQRVVTQLDALGDSWTLHYGELCRETRAHAGQAPDLADPRLACLDRRLSELRAHASVLARADAEVVSAAADAVANLRDPEVCRVLEGGRAEVPLPRDPETAAQVVRLQQRLDDATASAQARRFDESLAIAREVEAQAQQLPWLPVVAEARLRLATIAKGDGAFDESRRIAESALWAAEVGRHDAAAVDAWTFLIYLVGYSMDDLVLAHALVPRMEAALARLGTDPDRETDVHRTKGTLAFEAENWDVAIEHYQDALNTAERAYGTSHLLTARVDQNIGTALYRAGRLDESAKHLERALASYSRVRGDGHPALSTIHLSLGGLRRRQGDLPQALAHYELSLRLHDIGRSPVHHGAVLGHRNIGNVLAEMGDHEGAVPRFRRALEIELATRGKEAPPFSSSSDLADSLIALGQHAEAVACLEPVLATLATMPRHREAHGWVAFGLARALWEAEPAQRERALALARQALAIFEERGASERRATVETWLEAMGVEVSE